MKTSRWAAAAGVGLALAMLAAGGADARRGGSFGSRGMRTYSAPAPTATAPGYTAPIQRSMTSPQYGGAYGQTPRYGTSAYGPAYAPRPFGFGGGGFLGGLVAGGLLGSLMGHGWGYGWGGGWGGGFGGGLISSLFQLFILGLVIWFVVRMFRGRSPAFAGGPAPFITPAPGPGASTFTPITNGPWSGGGSTIEVPIGQSDRSAFEHLLIEVQDAFGHEDYGRLREVTTPEVMSYLAEELSENATHNRRNDVTGTKLLQADVAESWQENDAEYATVAMRYESIDLMRDRQTGAVLSGDPDKATQTTELWTFVRHTGVWKLSAIQTPQA
jgi:predicted lipid-binding transport protein (Tim44 family)